MGDMSEIIPKFIFGFLPFLFALCFHEYSHGWVANKLGDPTAKLMGRLTLNPHAHADMLGTYILPVVGMLTGIPLIGWAKPVPVNENNLRNKKTGMFWVALAGPGSNIFLALIGAFAYSVVEIYFPHASFSEGMLLFTGSFLWINLWLAFFNLLPLHPLDGGKVFAIFLPNEVNRKLESLQMSSQIILALLFFSGALVFVLQPVVSFTANGMLSIFSHLPRLGR
jgi:Zn-dependent protease